MWHIVATLLSASVGQQQVLQCMTRTQVRARTLAQAIMLALPKPSELPTGEVLVHPCVTVKAVCPMTVSEITAVSPLSRSILGSRKTRCSPFPASFHKNQYNLFTEPYNRKTLLEAQSTSG